MITVPFCTPRGNMNAAAISIPFARLPDNLFIKGPRYRLIWTDGNLSLRRVDA